MNSTAFFPLQTPTNSIANRIEHVSGPFTAMPRIFDQIKRKGKFPGSANHGEQVRSSPSSTNHATPGAVYQYANGATKVVDPVVAQLKEKRRLEREKKEQEMRQKKGLPPKTNKPKPTRTSSSSSSSSASVGRTRVPSSASLRQTHSVSGRNGHSASVRNAHPVSSPVERKPPAKKLNFNDLMKKASTIDQATLALSIKAKSRSPEHGKGTVSAASNGANNGTHSSNISRRPQQTHTRPPSGSHPRPAPNGSRSGSKEYRNINMEPKPVLARAPIPVRGPSANLLEKLKSKKTTTKNSSRAPLRDRRYGDSYNEEYDSYDEDMDSFVVDDDEEEDGYEQEEAYYGRSKRSQRDAGYDRDEIWAMFNKGRKRSYYNAYDEEDSDDMEATGAEILEEETRSRRQAEVEDRRELEEEKRRNAMKKARLGR